MNIGETAGRAARLDQPSAMWCVRATESWDIEHCDRRVSMAAAPVDTRAIAVVKPRHSELAVRGDYDGYFLVRRRAPSGLVA